MAYRRETMLELRDIAKRLGFQSDVDHWDEELKKLDEREASNG